MISLMGRIFEVGSFAKEFGRGPSMWAQSVDRPRASQSRQNERSSPISHGETDIYNDKFAHEVPPPQPTKATPNLALPHTPTDIFTEGQIVEGHK